VPNNLASSTSFVSLCCLLVVSFLFLLFCLEALASCLTYRFVQIAKVQRTHPLVATKDPVDSNRGLVITPKNEIHIFENPKWEMVPFELSNDPHEGAGERQLSR